MKKTLATLTVLSFLAFSTQASVFFDETFSYSDGALTNVSGGVWSAHSAGGTVPVMVASGAISLAQGSGSREDVNRSTGSTMTTGDTWYAGFDVRVSGGNSTVYFAHFITGTSVFGSRVFVTNTPTGLGDFTFGLGSGSSSPNAVWSEGLSYDTTYHLVVSYDFDSGDGHLWVNPSQQSDPSVYSTNFIANAFTGFGFRQASGNSLETIDNLTVATSFLEVVPEPSTLALVALGGVALLAARRRS